MSSRYDVYEALLNYPLTWVTIKWLLLVIYLRSSFFHIIEGTFGSLLSVVLVVATFVFLVVSIQWRLEAPPEQMQILRSACRSVIIPYFLLFHLHSIYRSVREENIYIRLSYWMVFFLVTMFSVIVSIILGVSLFSVPYKGVIVIIGFTLIGPIIHLPMFAARSVVDSEAIGLLTSGMFRRSVISIFSVATSLLILWFNL